MTPGDYVLIGVVIALSMLILFQLWQSGDDEDMELLIENGVLYLNNRRFSLVGAGNGSSDFESGRYKVTVKYSPTFQCELVYAEGFGWIGGYPECDAVLGNVRGKHAVLADVLAAERLRVLVIDAQESGNRVSLEVK